MYDDRRAGGSGASAKFVIFWQGRGQMSHLHQQHLFLQSYEKQVVTQSNFQSVTVLTSGSLSLHLTFDLGVKLCPEEGHVDEKDLNVMGGIQGKN